jgi:NADPH2:quinone reductase
MESVGVVERAGQGAEHLVGQRIIGIPVMANGGYASHAIVDAASALFVPASMSSVDAAALHFPFHLSWLALVERAKLEPGETVLIHAGAGGIGSGAVQLAKARGARVIATAGTDEKVAFCLELGADHAINYRNADFVAEVEELTYGNGVDVAFDTIGGEVTLQTLRCMGFNGRHLIVGFSEDIGLEDASYLTARPLAFGNFSVGGVCLAYVNDPHGFRRSLGFNFPSRVDGLSAHARILELLRTGAIRTVVGRELTFAEIPAALEAMERRETMGRQVVRL